MKNTLRIDFANRKIVMDRTFAKKCENTASAEYAQLQRVRADYSEFDVIRKEIKKNTKKESYKGLTYAYMESYITLHDDEEKSIRKTYDDMKLISQCHSVRYPVIKKWFLQQFPEVTKFGAENREEAAGKQSTATVIQLPALNTEEIPCEAERKNA